LLITADAGGSNDPRRWTWKKHLAAFALESGLEITVCHFPPGTSKWNKIEHRMFCHNTANWRGRPLTSYEVVIETIAATTTRTGLTIGAELDTGSYRLGSTVTAAEFQALPITPDAFHGDWNYTLAPVPPRTPDPPAVARRIDPALTAMLSDPALTGMPRSDFERLVAVSEPYWDALAEAAFQRRFHRPAATSTRRPAAWTTTTASWRRCCAARSDHQHSPRGAAGRHPHQPLQPVPGRSPAPGPAPRRRHTAARVTRPDPRTASSPPARQEPSGRSNLTVIQIQDPAVPVYWR
jgi:hypothetical protein